MFIVTFEDRCSNIKLEPPRFGTETADQGIFEVETYFFSPASYQDQIIEEDCGEIQYSLLIEPDVLPEDQEVV